MIVPAYIPNSQVLGKIFSTSLSTSVILLFLYDNLSDQSEVVPHYGFSCISLMTGDPEYIFICLLAIFILSFEKCLAIYVLCPFLNSIVYFIVELFEILIYSGY